MLQLTDTVNIVAALKILLTIHNNKQIVVQNTLSVSQQSSQQPQHKHW